MVLCQLGVVRLCGELAPWLAGVSACPIQSFETFETLWNDMGLAKTAW